jgi:hypothetical protein
MGLMSGPPPMGGMPPQGGPPPMQGQPPMGGPPPQAQPPQDLPPQIKQKIMEALTSAGMQPAQAQQIMQAAINGDQQALDIIKQVSGAGGGAPAGGGMPPGGGMGG